jgi:hypothetical protein
MMTPQIAVHPAFDLDDEMVVDTFDRREDLSVQVKLTPHGEWHRKAVGGARTACGRALGGYATRIEQYMGKLCEDGCFSKWEISQIPTPAPDDAPDRG